MTTGSKLFPEKKYYRFHFISLDCDWQVYCPRFPLFLHDECRKLHFKPCLEQKIENTFEFLLFTQWSSKYSHNASVATAHIRDIQKEWKQQQQQLCMGEPN